MLPSARFIDSAPPPDPRSAVEIEKDATAGAARVFEHKMSVEQNGFNFSKKRVVAIDVCPARLHHADLRIGEMVDSTQKKILWRYEVGIENSDELAFCCLQSFRECTGFEPETLPAVVVGDGVSQSCIPLHQIARNRPGFVRGIVQHLDVQLLSRIVQPANGIQETINNVLLVKDWKLNRDSWQIREIR